VSRLLVAVSVSSMYALIDVLLASDICVLWVGTVHTRGQDDGFEIMMCPACLLS
jgi:hypothetical protein